MDDADFCVIMQRDYSLWRSELANRAIPIVRTNSPDWAHFRAVLIEATGPALDRAVQDQGHVAVVRPSAGDELIRPDAPVDRAAAGGQRSSDQGAHGIVVDDIWIGAKRQQGLRLPFEESLAQPRHYTRNA
jgi:hypothetical protein